MNICFIANFSKTKVFSSIANVLQGNEITVYWIACNQKIYNELCLEYKADQVLLINRKHVDLPQASVADFKINELVYGDRVLRHNYEDGIKFLSHIQKPIYKFLKDNDIRKVFGEVTWAHELLIHRMCSQLPELNCQYLNPHVIRIPNQRFAFFTDEKQSELLAVRRATPEAYDDIVPKPPSYLKINRKILGRASSLRGKYNRIRRFFSNENMDALDPCLNADNKIRIKVSVKEEWQRWQYRKVNKVDDIDLRVKPYLFLGLHKQPESSVDVLGRYYEDQYQNIVNLWRALPSGWNFIIKEHSIAIGDRALSFYKRIQALPGVVLVNEQFASYELIKQARLVATVSGTIAYEAALMGVPAVTFAPCFFNQLNRCQKISLSELDQFSLHQLASKLLQTPNNIGAFSKDVYTNSFSGNVLDPITDPNVLSRENITKLSSAYLQVVTKSQKAIAA